MSSTINFMNDPIEMLIDAFKKILESDEKEYVINIQLDPDLHNMHECYGVTEIPKDSTNEYFISIDAHISYYAILDTLCHEFAHVLVGIEHDHDKEWDKAYDRIHSKYMEIGELRYASDI